MRLLGRARFLLALSLLASVTSACAECAWVFAVGLAPVLWRRGRRGGRPSRRSAQSPRWSENIRVAFHMRRISSRLFMVFDFSSSNCRFASTPAVFTSLVTRRCSATLPASRPRALGRRGALLRCAGASPGVEAVSAVRGVLPSDDRVGSSALAGRLPGRTLGDRAWLSV
jgi:hypothetical protein